MQLRIRYLRPYWIAGFDSPFDAGKAAILLAYAGQIENLWPKLQSLHDRGLLPELTRRDGLTFAERWRKAMGRA